MAQLRPRRDKYVARIRWYIRTGKRVEKNIPLRTSSKMVARERFAEVIKVEEDIKQGMEFSFPWLSDSTITKVRRLTLRIAADKWIDKRMKHLAIKTIDSNQLSMDYFMKFLGESIPLESITTNQIERFIDYLEGMCLSKTTINIHLRTIKTMFRHYLKVEMLIKIPVIDQLKIPKSDPKYITDDEFQAIMNLKWLDDFHKRVFLLFRETGMRLNEPMIATLEGKWVDIPNTSKGKKPRSIELDEPMKAIFLELKEWLNNGYGSRLVDSGDHLSKYFKRAIREIGADDSKHFHSLRHTFAVRKLIQGVSIYTLKLLMGHSSVTTTEVYSEMNLKRVAQDFPTLVQNYVNNAKIGKVDTDIVDTIALPMTYVS